jgi:hypothetical protein
VVEIGLRDVYDELRKVSAGYGELAGKLDTAMSLHGMRFDAVGRELASMGREITDHEVRIRVVEQRAVVTPRAMWTAIGTLTGLVSVALAIVALFVK